MVEELANNVIRFPIDKIPTPPHTLDETLVNLEAVRKNFVDEFMQTHVMEFQHKLKMFGLNITRTEELFEEYVYAMEVMKAVLYRASDITHPWHSVFDMQREELIEEDDPLDDAS